MTGEPLRVGILGAGFMGRTHAHCFASIPGVEVASVYAKSAKRASPLAEEVGAGWTTDVADILDDASIQAISVCLPTALHPRYVAEALKRGKHVLCEKPLALTEEDGQTMVELSERSNATVMIGHVLRFWPEYVELHRIVAKGSLGRPIAGFASRRSATPDWSELYSDSSLTGGTIVDLQIHDLDILLWIFGQPQSVFASGVRNYRTGGWDHNLVTLDYDGLAVASAEGSHMMPGNYPFNSTLRVLCERGSIEHHFRAAGTGITSEGEAISELTIYPQMGTPRSVEYESRDHPYEAQIEYFVRCARQNIPAERGTPKQALAALRLALAARSSLEQGRRIDLT